MTSKKPKLFLTVYATVGSFFLAKNPDFGDKKCYKTTLDEDRTLFFLLKAGIHIVLRRSFKSEQKKFKF